MNYENSERISVNEAAKILGRPAQYVRLHLRDGSLREIGDAKPPAPGSSKWTYDIYKKRLLKYVGG
ncbi:MAG: hypothetical protein LIO87_09185 [Eubacterium sp.]|nr:hypothetical protein [Eubacterium sp.]